MNILKYTTSLTIVKTPEKLKAIPKSQIDGFQKKHKNACD